MLKKPNIMVVTDFTNGKLNDYRFQSQLSLKFYLNYLPIPFEALRGYYRSTVVGHDVALYNLLVCEAFQ